MILPFPTNKILSEMILPFPTNKILLETILPFPTKKILLEMILPSLSSLKASLTAFGVCIFASLCAGKKKKLNNQKDWHPAMKASSLGTPFLRLHVLGFFVSRNNE